MEGPLYLENIMAIDFKPVADAGLTQTELAALLGVTRVTVHHWIVKGTEPAPYLRRALLDLLGALQDGVEAGMLPGPLQSLTPSRHTMDERRRIIDDAIAQVRRD
jgi:hypothetical protein